MSAEFDQQLLSAIHFPDSSPGRGSQYLRHLGRLAGGRERHNTRAKIQPDYPDDEQRILAQWRSDVIKHIDARISQFKPGAWSTQIARVHRPTSAASGHRALRIPELLDKILMFAGPASQLSAWYVSSGWRRSAKSVIGSCNGPTFWNVQPGHVPVEYGSTVDDSAETWIAPTQQELDAFSHIVSQTMQRVERGCAPRDKWPQEHVNKKILYFPARYTQAPSLPPAFSTVLDHLDDAQHAAITSTYYMIQDQPTSRNPDRYWLDFSQFDLNPHFTALFPSRLSCVSGRIEIGLRQCNSHETAHVLDPLFSRGLTDFLGSMFLTQPPCQVVGIYHCANTTLGYRGYREHCETSKKELLVRLRNDEGVKVGQVLAALIKYAPRVLSAWLAQAASLKAKVSSGHWQEDIWRVPGSPRFVMLLDSKTMRQDWVNDRAHQERVLRAAYLEPSTEAHEAVEAISMPLSVCGHVTRPQYLIADAFREDRQTEWVPKELIEPASSSIRHPVNWDI